jgi:hypothetical protein
LMRQRLLTRSFQQRNGLRCLKPQYQRHYRNEAICVSVFAA